MEKISEEENFLGFTEDQVEEFREVFTIFDKDKNGIIDIKEMGVVMRALGQDPSRQRLEEKIREFDENKDGVISFDEFLDLMAVMINKVDEVSFRVFCLKNIGHLSGQNALNVSCRDEFLRFLEFSLSR